MGELWRGTWSAGIDLHVQCGSSGHPVGRGTVVCGWGAGPAGAWEGVLCDQGPWAMVVGGVVLARGAAPRSSAEPAPRAQRRSSSGRRAGRPRARPTIPAPSHSRRKPTSCRTAPWARPSAPAPRTPRARPPGLEVRGDLDPRTVRRRRERARRAPGRLAAWTAATRAAGGAFLGRAEEGGGVGPG